MITDITACMLSTQSRTWVITTLVDTGQIAGAILVLDTRLLALNIRVTNVVADTFAAGLAVTLSAFSIDTTGRGIAGLENSNRTRGSDDGIANREGIAHKVFLTGTDRQMIVHPTIGIDATDSRTRVYTPLILTGFIIGTILTHKTFRVAIGR